MAKIILSNNSIKYVGDSWENVNVYYVHQTKIILIGMIRAKDDDINFHIYNTLNNIDSKIRIHEFFTKISGEYLMIIQEEDRICISLNYSFPQMYIYKEPTKLILTNSEADTIKNGFDEENYLLRMITTQSFYLPMGIGSNVDDVILPGMCIDLDFKLNYEQGWILPVELFCSSDSHAKSVDDMINSLVNEFKSHKLNDVRHTLQLSSGIDSALFLAAIKESGLSVESVNFHAPDDNGERVGALNTAQYFGYKLTEFGAGPCEIGTKFTTNTDIATYLEKMKPLLNTGSAMVILANVSLLVAYHYGYHHSFEGSGFPRALCITHYAEYPNIKTCFKFKPERNNEKRLRYSYDYAHKKQQTNDFTDDYWNIGSRWSNIHPYYWEYLFSCFSGSLRETTWDKKMFPMMIDPKFFDEILHEIMIRKGDFILSKVMASDYVKNKLQNPDPEFAIKLQKFVAFILNPSWATSKMYNYRKSKLLNQFRPGLSSAFLMDLFKVPIDDLLVNNSKWHIFESFKKLSGKDFFEIQKMAYTSQLFDNIKWKIGLTQNFTDVRKLLLKNNDFLRFSDKYNIEKIHAYQLNTLDKDVYHVINKISKNADYNTGTLYWYNNNKINNAILFQSSEDNQE
jgi:hypothetical protein